MLPPYSTPGGAAEGIDQEPPVGTSGATAEHNKWLLLSGCPPTIVCVADHVYELDFRDLIAQHRVTRRFACSFESSSIAA